MLAFLVVVMAAAGLYYVLGGAPALRVERGRPTNPTEAKIAELSEYAQRLQGSNKYLAAEKVYLQILKLNHKHVPTYSRLGSLYAAIKNYPDAVECHQIAAQLAPGAVTHYNLALCYYENQNYIKSVAAFEKSIMFEPSVARLIGLAKAFQKLRDIGKMISALEQAAGIEAQPRTLWLLVDAYRLAGRPEEASPILQKIRLSDPQNARLKQESQTTGNTATRVENTPVK